MLSSDQRVPAGIDQGVRGAKGQPEDFERVRPSESCEGE